MSEDEAVPTMGAGELRRVVSADGTEIVLERVTRGSEVLVMVPGATSGRARWASVAARLDGRFTCWLMDRRGKGDSGDTLPYSFEREYEDLEAVVGSFDRAVGVAAHSSGAVCALGAVLRGMQARSLVLYEPPWPLEGSVIDRDRIDAMDSLLAAGDRDGALVVAFREVVGMPQPVVDAMRRAPIWADWSSLVHTWPREMRELVRAGAWDLAPLATITVPTLMLDGVLSPPYLRRTTAAVAGALPSSTITELAGQAHGAIGLAPDLVAAAVLAFAGAC